MEFDDARHRAEMVLAEAETDVPLKLNLELVQSNRHFWVFPFNSVAWLEHNDVSALVPSGPIVVDQASGDTWIAPSAQPVADYIRGLEAEHGIEHSPLAAHQ